MKSTIWLLGVLAAGVVALLLFNSYLYAEKQGPEAELGDGTHLGFIHGVTDNNTSMDFDDAVWLTGTAGEDAAIEAGLCTETTRPECLPNDFYIYNEAADDEHMAVGANAQVYTQTWQMEQTGQVTERQISLDEFAEAINNSNLHWRQLPYRIEVENGEVVRIEEVYIP